MDEKLAFTVDGAWRAMMILLTGGSGCGKSAFAERLCMQLPSPRYYIAAMRPFGEGGEQKIARHRLLRRDKGFATIERYTDLGGLVLPARGTALLECVCNLTANEMFDERGTITEPVQRVTEGIDALSNRCAHLIVVTNDVGSDLPPADAATNRYIASLGRINGALAARADTVCELVCGIPILLKGALPV